ncbi:MAG: CPBP family intramembrane metalloprotease [Phycisphaerae bacterium]|nr:CPBP family intramembrane metalloprotease [Phycisphaerae bacterium]
MRAVSRVFCALGLYVLVSFLGMMGVPSLLMKTGLGRLCGWCISSGLVTQATFLVSALVLMRVIGGGDWARFGLRTARPGIVLRAVAISAAAMLLLMSPLLVLSMMIPAPAGQGPSGPGPASEGLLERIILIWLIASTCEEVFYRGLLQGFLSPLAAYGVRLRIARISLPVAFCAVLFGLSHLCLIRIFPPPLVASILVSTTVAGLVAGYYRERTGSLIPAIAVHMTFNVVGTLAPLLLSTACRPQ